MHAAGRDRDYWTPKNYDGGAFNKRFLLALFIYIKSHYVAVDEDELKAVEIESTHTVDITGFVPKADIDERYLDKPYYITPEGKMGADAFAVIRDAMKDKDRVALAKIVIASRAHYRP